MRTLHDTVERFERLILHADIIKAQRLLHADIIKAQGLLHADIIKAQGRTRTSKIGLLQRLRTKLKLRTRLTRLMTSSSQREDKTLHSPIFS